jgi:hypothetical protein
MKSKLTAAVVMAAAGTLAALLGAPEARAADVGVSISISQPGVYGRIDIGQYPQPAVVVQQPVIIRQPRVVAVEPVYLWVPPGHQKNWAKHCGRYNACGVPVYFVREDWYRRHVAPQPVYEERRGPPGHSHGHGHGRGRGHDD